MSSSLRLSIVKWRRLSRWPFSKEENVDLSLLVAILDGGGPDSRWLSSNRKFFHFVVFILFDYVSQLLSATAQGLSLGGCPIVKRWMKRHEKDSSSKGVQCTNKVSVTL
ncbi:hypothetical protein HID58_065477 [Brassica napus]|uniref:Uncharacterized protein n=1 Tax=Brassica napus TaxID=3708 RepID=A0ABQ7ZD94_BRANA|nr:hypothetical protein HID58_065477 [Brassica napus]